MVDFIGIERIQELVTRRGTARFIEELAGEIEADFLRWRVFDKSPRHATHSPGGVIELMAGLGRTAVRLQVRERTPAEHRGGAAHGDGVRSPGGCSDRLPAAACGADPHHGAAHRRNLGTGGPPHGPPGQPRDGPDRQRRAERIPDHRLPSHARHPRSAAVRHRCRCEPPSSSTISHGCSYRTCRCSAAGRPRRPCRAPISSRPSTGRQAQRHDSDTADDHRGRTP